MPAIHLGFPFPSAHLAFSLFLPDDRRQPFAPQAVISRGNACTFAQRPEFTVERLLYRHTSQSTKQENLLIPRPFLDESLANLVLFLAEPVPIYLTLLVKYWTSAAISQDTAQLTFSPLPIFEREKHSPKRRENAHYRGAASPERKRRREGGGWKTSWAKCERREAPVFHYLCFYNPYSTLSSAPFFQDSTLQFNYSLGARGRGVRKRKKTFLRQTNYFFAPQGQLRIPFTLGKKDIPSRRWPGAPFWVFFAGICLCVCARVMGILISRLAVTKETGCL